MKKTRPTYQELEKRLAAAEPIVEALKAHEVDAVIGEEKITFLLLQEVGESLLCCEAELKAIFNLPGIGIIQADAPSFRLTKANARFCQMTGYSLDELLTRTYIGFTHPDDRNRDMKNLAQIIRGKTDAWSIEKRCICKDGSTLWIQVHGSVIRDDSGRATRIVATVSDITPRKLAQLGVAPATPAAPRAVSRPKASKPKTPVRRTTTSVKTRPKRS